MYLNIQNDLFTDITRRSGQVKLRWSVHRSRPEESSSASVRPITTFASTRWIARTGLSASWRTIHIRTGWIQSSGATRFDYCTYWFSSQVYTALFEINWFPVQFQPALRFLSGSKDGTARIWSFVNHKWTSIVLNMSTGDNREKKPQSTLAPTPSIAPSSSLAAQPGPSSGDRSSLRRQPSASNAGNVRPVRAAAAAAASTFATAAAAASHHDENGEETAHSAAAAAAAAKLEKRVTMVAWWVKMIFRK